jgi:hypothetical protein
MSFSGTSGRWVVVAFELAPVRPGLDVRQLALTATLTLLALGLGLAAALLGAGAKLF